MGLIIRDKAKVVFASKTGEAKAANKHKVSMATMASSGVDPPQGRQLVTTPMLALRAKSNALCFLREKLQGLTMAENSELEAVQHIMATLFSAQNALRSLAPEFRWAGLGNLLGDYGEYVAIEAYGLERRLQARTDLTPQRRMARPSKSKPTTQQVRLGLEAKLICCSLYASKPMATGAKSIIAHSQQ